MNTSDPGVVLGAVVSGLPHPLLCPDANPGYASLAHAFRQLRQQILATKPDLLILYSTMWPSIVGHQIQADPSPEWVHVDELFHDLGSIPYGFRIDSDFAHLWHDCAKRRGLSTRTINYHGFPIDTGSITALKLLNPDNAIPAVICSSNVYADRSETVVLGKATADAVREAGKRAVGISIMSLSNRLFTDFIDPAEDRIHSEKDEEWNQKLLELFSHGRLEDISQLSREIHRQIRVSKVVNFKAMWWLSSMLGAHNHYHGTVHGYAPIVGTGAAVIGLQPTGREAGDLEYDEDDVEVYRGDRAVLG